MRVGLTIALVAASGCASAGGSGTEVDAMETGSDGMMTMIDAAPMIDAPVTCATPMMVNLLTNPSFDLTPVGMGWTETRIMNETIIRGDAGITEDTAPNLAWLGGFEGTGLTDALDQMVMVPASTTAIVLRGRYAVGTAETVANIDTLKIGVLPMTGTTYIGPTFDATNSMPSMVFVDFSVTLPHAMLAGQTVRAHLTSTSGNATGNTNFFVDTLALMATYCPP